MRFTTLVYTTNIIELVAAILATIHYKKYATSTEKYFLHFLWLVVFTETTGTIVGPILKIPNIWVYIPYIIISFLFYFYWYYSILKKICLKKLFFLVVVFF